jgi:protein-S-isoprenylcysteine O-methyltransferase Ste14
VVALRDQGRGQPAPGRALITRRLRSTSFRTFVLYPLVVVGWELFLNEGRLQLAPWFAPLLLWGYLQYRLVGSYRLRRGGGGPGMDTPPEDLVTGGPYAYTRNPMYLGHLIFLIGLALTLKSVLAALIAAASAVWFHFRVRRDENRLRERFGQAYIGYQERVKRWLPGIL